MPRLSQNASASTRSEFDEDCALPQPHKLSGGETQTGQLSGTKALMLAVLENGIRNFLSGSRSRANEAERWISSYRARSPFSFVVVCETLGLDSDAVRERLWRLKREHVPTRKAVPRARHNVRASGRVAVRRAC